ncbi:hypothetical protein AGMMS50243_19160 [Betaproteobacteria bacterium]|nr:hypothetical protein AGMMS50243_19160 [Betaproteobacteria bacterium]
MFEPRAQHVAWDGICLPHDHPFWQTHFAPNGFGCCCRIIAVSAPGKGDITEPPEGWDEIDPATGEQKGIGKGWGYAPGASEEEELRWIAEQKAAKLPGEIATDFLAQVDKAGLGVSAAALEVIKINQLDGSARAFVVGKGRTTGKEYLAIYDEGTGKEVGRYGSGLDNEVGTPKALEPLFLDRDSALVLLHNHADSRSLSKQDLMQLTYPGVKRVVAYGHDRKSVFSATKGAEIDLLPQVKEAAAEECANQLDLLLRRGLNMEGLEAHLLNLGLERAGIIHYDAKLEPKRNRVYIHEKAAIDAAAEEIVRAINRARPARN